MESAGAEAPWTRPSGFSDPAQVRLADWKKMADGPLKVERQVEQYVVEPLLRLSLPKRRSVRCQKQYRLKSGIADYVLLESDTPRSVIEVKLGVRTPRAGDWSQSPDFQQVLSPDLSPLG
jgi:hypothetical protein